MKRTLIAVACAVTASMALSACAEDMGYGYFGGDAAYYDGFYGPFYNGYWGPDGAFYYSTGRGRPYLRDDARHFRHERHDGFHGVRGHHDRGWDHYRDDHDHDEHR